jgi:hypothetical protein
MTARTPLLTLLFCLSFATLSRVARADEAEGQQPRSTRWYGTPAVVADVAALGLFTAGAAASLSQFCMDLSGVLDDPRRPSDPRESRCYGHKNGLPEALMVSSIFPYMLVGPIHHALRGHWDKAALGFGLRAAPLAIGVPMMAAGGGAGAAGLGVVFFGAIASMVIDDFVIARERTFEPAGLSVSPSFDPTTRSAALSLSGSF